MGTVKKQKGVRKCALKNRYCAGAKLSEHKFLRVLRGFAEGVTLSALEPLTHVSGKTIRASYGTLRNRLALAVFDEADQFGGAGHYLSLPDASTLLNAISASAQFRRYRKRHAPRLRDANDECLLVMEFAVRMFCALDLRNVTSEQDGVLQALSFGIGALRARDQLQEVAKFIPGARPHAHPAVRLYEEYRRCLLKAPLRTNLGAQ